jgi:hypothetical protein
MQQGRQECRPSDGPATLLSPMVATKACFAPPPPTLSRSAPDRIAPAHSIMKSNTFYSVLGGALLALITTVAARAAAPFPAHQDLTYGCAQFLQCIRFVQENLRPLGKVSGYHLGLPIPAGQNYREVGRPLSQSRHCLPAVHTGHGHVAPHALDFRSVLPEELHRLDAVRRRQHGIARVVSNSIDEAAALEWFGELAP